ncbi:MAG: DegT/DnrJ/EryC1/StrS family aminotransferase [Candidatus Thalassarchaeaceae archaeon]|jgi:dTDP-4-amino-4,6-dideoxygalactose transaminase|nr:DegT/DnrJ/EryC1/StrS family aminotransferase [Candidatus Thalassarchaeaceae archaeon]
MEHIPLAKTYLDDEIRDLTLEVLDSGQWVKGPQSKAFGSEWAEWCGALAGAPTSNGSTALIAALRLLRIGPGDEVIVPSLTFISSSTCIDQVGATPIFVDVEPEYYTMCPQSVEEAITPSTKAIIAVHLFGQVVDPKIMNLGVPVIEDAAQAHGAEYNGDKVGSLGNLATFSFFPSKNLTVGGDGGALLANSKAHTGILTASTDHGRHQKGEYNFLSSNFRLSEVQCAIGRAQLKHLEKWCQRRREIAEKYSKSFHPNSIPKVRERSKHGWNQYVLKITKPKLFREYMDNCGIDTAIHYSTPTHLQPIYSQHHQSKLGTLPFTEEICKNLVAIPVFPQLTDDEVEYIISSIQAWQSDILA